MSAFAVDDTIVAVATPPGVGGLGVVRLSGADASRIGRCLADRLREWSPRRAVYARIDAGHCVTDGVVTWFEAPASFTGEDVVEIGLAGNPLLLAGVVERAVAHGARVARPGEFTFRAYLSGRIDLVQAEALRDLVNAVSPAQLQAAAGQQRGELSGAIGRIVEDLRELELLLEASVDFPDEGYRFIDGGAVERRLRGAVDAMRGLLAGEARSRVVSDGLTVVIAGAPNTGKSSLFNALLGADRAIVTPVPGTTRDLISERLLVNGRLVRLVDSAGLREADDAVEREGVRRAEAAAERADLVLFVVDGSRPLDEESRRRVEARGGARTLAVMTKADLPAAWVPAREGLSDVVVVSSKTGAGVADLAARVGALASGAVDGAVDVLVTNERHRGLLREALGHVDHARYEFAQHARRLPEEFVLEDIRAALGVLAEVTGRRSADELLHGIFSAFCIGK